MVLLGVLLAAVIPAFGQSAPSTASAASATAPAYEVVSVKPSKPGCLGFSVTVPHGRFEARCATLWDLLYNAYAIKHTDYPQGLPNWGHSARFDVDAKMDDATAEAMPRLNREEGAQRPQLMLRALLADRFKLRVHTETKQGDVYELVIAHGGAKLKPSQAGAAARGMSMGRSNIKIQGQGTAALASCLTDALDRSVIDKTGLSGNYDIDLRWTPDEQQGTADAGPTIFTAIQEQLGLKLARGKGPVVTFVVDHAEQPAEN